MTTKPLTIDDPAYFTRLAEVDSAHWWSLGMWRIAACWLAEALKGRGGLHALDVGCGTGMGAVRLAERPEIEQVVGVDPSPYALVEARRSHRFPLVQGSALALPFAAGRFDVVTCFDVIQHLGDGRLREAASELRRVLRPEGIAVLRSNTEPRGTRLEQLRLVFAETGFTVRRASYANCLPALAQELRARLAGTRRSGHPAGGGLQIRVPHPWVNRAMGRVAAAEAFVAGRLAARLPFGHSTMLLVQVQPVVS
jgi:ubiquinone/menaquinone biosynthesis C-methylase UbiE